MRGRAHGAGHACACVDIQKRLEELALRRNCLVNPREHVPYVPQRVVCVQLDRPCACAAGRTSGSQCAHEGGERGRLACLREHGERFTGQGGRLTCVRRGEVVGEVAHARSSGRERRRRAASLSSLDTSRDASRPMLRNSELHHRTSLSYAFSR